MVLTRDFQSAMPVDMGDAQLPLPSGLDTGIPDGQDGVGTPADEFADPAASGFGDGTADEDPTAALREQILSEVRPQIENEATQLWRERIAELQNVKDTELHQANVALARERVQMQTMVDFLKQRAADLGLSDGDFAILENNGRKRADAVTQGMNQARAEWRAAQEDLSARLEEHLAAAHGPAEQRSYNPWADPEFRNKWGAAMSTAARYYGTGQTDQGLLLAGQHALAEVREHIYRKGQGSAVNGSQPAQPGSQPQQPAQRLTPPNPQQVRADARASGPTAPAKTGGTGKMSDDAVWDMAQQKFPKDEQYPARYREYLKLRQQYQVTE